MRERKKSIIWYVVPCRNHSIDNSQRLVYTMQLVPHSSSQIYWFVDYLIGLSTMVQKNRMIQIASCELALRQQILSCDKFILSILSRNKSNLPLEGTLSHDCKIGTCCNVTEAFSVWLPAECCDMLHRFSCIRLVYYKTLLPWMPMFYYILSLRWRHSYSVKSHS